jgi:hypothetical protein
MTESIQGLDEAPDLVLTKADLSSPTWLKLVKHMEACQQRLRAKNDSPALDALATAGLRGELKTFKNLLALANPSPAVVADEGQPE